MGQSESPAKIPSNPTQPIHSTLKTVPYWVAYDGLWYGMLCLAVALLTICALLAGLTLAVCGLNTTFLHLRSVIGTSKQRQQALVVARMKRHHSWMLCSLIICSVLCGESLPFVIQSLWDQPKQWWVPIVISTLSIAFFAEIAPQYWVPRHAIEWGYYCWPIIWGSMWITSIFSWPLAKLLDYCSGTRDEHSTFSNDELAGLIKYHERSEKLGGSLGQDTARVMLGALSLDAHKIGANFSPFPETRSSYSNDKDSDVEKADLVIVHGMVVNWSAVKTVEIDEPVDKAFIKKVRSWSYSRIPVIGEAQVEQAEPSGNRSLYSGWDAKKIFGFLHIKNLIGIKINDKHDSNTGLLVRDLPLYPLPIVMDDMPAYSLLNMFHLGMSRMAVVLPTPERAAIGKLVTPKKAANPPHFQAPCWTGTERTNTRIKSRLRRMDAQPGWTKAFLDGALSGIEISKDRRHNIIGIRCPEPLGIITFEDIIDTILQKTSRDERDFYCRENASSRTNGEKAGDGPTILTAHADDERNSVVPSYIHDTYLLFPKSKENISLRKRKPSNKDRAATTMDGADECSVDTEADIQVKKSRKDCVESSYTQNSRGGFHRADDSSCSIENFMLMTPEKLASLGVAPPSTPSNLDTGKAASLPSRKEAPPLLPGDWNPFTRRYVSAMPDLPTFSRVTPFSRQDSSSYAKKSDGEHDDTELIMPSPSMVTAPEDHRFGANISGMNISNTIERSSSILGGTERADREDSHDTISLSSWNYGNPYDVDDLNSRVCNASFAVSALEDFHDNRVQFSTRVPQNRAETARDVSYPGFPSELLDNPKENQVPDFASKTLPRTVSFKVGLDDSNDRRDCDAPIREGSFHDDRALLPSQRRVLNGNADWNLSGMRSTSFWF